MLPRLAMTFAVAASVCAAPLYAQPPQPESDGTAPAHVSHVDGTASLEREGRADSSPLNLPLVSGDRLRTADGRVEVLFADGSTLHLDMRSTIDVQSDDLVRLTDGRLRLNILGPTRAVSYRIDSPAGSARITEPGEYRIALLRSSTPPGASGSDEIQLELAVVRGAAEVFTDQGTTPVRAGERAYASTGKAPSYAYAYNTANWDAFDRWSEERRDVRLGVSSQYLPADMQAYAPLLDESGDWRYTESYGYAWYPRVTTEWRPYYYGRWASYPRYGWTWIGVDRFAWPTHHYGRWGFSAGVWFWIPSSRWAPANVSWAYAPGYVSWCPLGFDNRPIVAIDIVRGGPDYYSPWRAWTAVSYSHFGGRDSFVNQRAMNWDRFTGQRPRFEARASAPGFSRDTAVARNSTPIRWAGSRTSAPRGGSQGPFPRDTAAPARGSGLPPAAAAGVSANRRSVGADRSAGRDAAVPRTSGTPRYVNRGDEIVRSQTARPTPRGASAAGLPAREEHAVPRGGETRTIPEAPGRQSRPEFERVPRTDVGPSRERPADQPRAYAPRQGQSPAYQPNQPRGYEPQSRPANDAPRTAPPAPGREPAPRGYERPRSGGNEGPPPRQAPAERAAPAERGAPHASGGVAAPRQGGRGGS